MVSPLPEPGREIDPDQPIPDDPSELLPDAPEELPPPPIVDGRIERRRSAAFFHDGNIDAVIETLPTCLDADGTSAYGPTTVGEHIRAKLAGSRAGVANPEAEREAARVLAARPS